MKTLITGGAGFVGLALSEQLLGRGDVVTIADKNPIPDIARDAFAKLPGTFNYLAFDVTDRASIDGIFKATKPDRLVHGAAITAGIDRDMTDPRATVLVNLVGTIDTLTAARDYGVKRIVYPSTGALFGETGFTAKHLLDEIEDKPVPISVYGISKYAAERTALRLKDLWKLDLVVGRLAMVYGRWEYATGVRDTLSPVYRVTQMALRGEPVVFRETGPIDWIYSPDIAGMLTKLLDAPSDQLRSNVYHLGTGEPWPLTAWCDLLKTRIPGFSYRVSPNESEWTVAGIAVTMRAPMKVDRIRTDTGYAVQYGVQKAFDDYFPWISAQR